MPAVQGQAAGGSSRRSLILKDGCLLGRKSVLLQTMSVFLKVCMKNELKKIPWLMHLYVWAFVPVCLSTQYVYTCA